MPVEAPGSPVTGFSSYRVYLYHPGTENAAQGILWACFMPEPGKRDKKKRFEYVLGVLCGEPSFFPADSLEGHFTRKKSAIMQKTAEKCRPGRGRKREKDTRKTARRGAVSMLRFDSTYTLNTRNTVDTKRTTNTTNA